MRRPLATAAALMVIALLAPATAAHACDCGAPGGPVIGGVVVEWLLAGAVALAMAGALTLAGRRRGATLPAWRPRSD